MARFFPAIHPITPRRKQVVGLILVCSVIVLLACVLLLIPLLTSGADLWVGADWIDGRKLFSIDDAYRYFAGRNAFRVPAIFLWDYVMPLAVLFDAALSAVCSGSLIGMRIGHAFVGVLTLAIIARTSRRAGCQPMLTVASLLIIGLMPVYVVLSSSFYAEGLFAFLLTVDFLLLIEGRHTPLAIITGFLPLVRPEGAVYAALFLLYFGFRRDLKRCIWVLLPGFVYAGALFAVRGDLSSLLSWRLELRKILSSELAQGGREEITLGRLLNPVWVLLAMAPLWMRRYREWWPVLLGPWLLVLFQTTAIVRGVQDFELRYFFSAIPVFGVAWALPLQSLLRGSGTSLRRGIVTILTVSVCLLTIVFHLNQSDWLRLYYREPARFWDEVRQQTPRGRSLGDKTLLFDPRPLRAFSARTDSYLRTHKDIQAVFVADPAPLYFLNFLQDDPTHDAVLIPHNSNIASFSGGYHFGFDLGRMTYGYFKFYPRERGQLTPAMLIVKDSGYSPFAYLGGNSGAMTESVARGGRVAPNIQSRPWEAFSVTYDSRNAVEWTFPGSADE